MKNKLRARGLNMSHELEGESHIAEKIPQKILDLRLQQLQRFTIT